MVFLDIDGVLDIYQPDLQVQEFLPGAIQTLCDFIHKTETKIVIISTYRLGGENWTNITNILNKNNIYDIDVTPSGEKYHTRTNEIKAYLDRNPDISKYVILDDCFQDDYRSDLEIHSHLVFVDALKGLQKEDMEKAYRILNNM